MVWLWSMSQWYPVTSQLRNWFTRNVFYQATTWKTLWQFFKRIFSTETQSIWQYSLNSVDSFFVTNSYNLLIIIGIDLKIWVIHFTYFKVLMKNQRMCVFHKYPHFMVQFLLFLNVWMEQKVSRKHLHVNIDSNEC